MNLSPHTVIEVQGSGGFYPWTQFNTQCWSPEEGVAYAGEPVNVIAITVEGDNAEDREFAFCLNKITPSGDTCLPPPVMTPSVDGPGGGMSSGGDGVIAVVGGVPGTDGNGANAASDGATGVAVGVPAAGDGLTAPSGDAVSPDPGTAMPGAVSQSRSSSSAGCSLPARSGGSSESALVLSLSLVALGALSRRRRAEASSNELGDARR